MRIRRLEINNFRGIHQLSRTFDSAFMCLVGPGDSTKTTILDALGAVLSSRYNLTFTDADFYKCETAQPVTIEVVITELPDKLVEERSHGKNRSGIAADGTLHHDPLDQEGVEECLIIRLTVDETLEPVWEVVRPGEAGGARITASERAELGFFRIGDAFDPHLRWGRSSALASLTSSRTGATHAVVEAQRHARKAVQELSDTPLHEAATLARDSAVKLGSAPFTDLRPGLDPTMSAGTSALVLHEGPVPLTNYGLGSRRLTSLAIQQDAVPGNSIMAIDEVEHGLDPHRLLHLIRYLRAQTTTNQLQVILTTHSPLVVETLTTSELFVVRTKAGATSIVPVPPAVGTTSPDTIQGLIRARPSALLARRVVVGEGPTETGLLKQLVWRWDQELEASGQLNAASMGVAVSDGAGDSQAPVRAAALARLGYPTMLMIDGDVTSNASSVADAITAGVAVLRWPDGQALEDVIVESLPLAGLQDLVDIAIDEVSEESVLTRMGNRLGTAVTTSRIADWVAVHGEPVVRQAVAFVAKGSTKGGAKEEKRAWFKREDRGGRLGDLLFMHRSAISAESELAKGIARVKAFAYAQASLPPAQAAPRP